MRELKGSMKRGLLLLVAGIMVAGAMLLLPGPSTTAAIGPDCGPTYEWSCALPGCPECYETLFVGTVCEKEAYEAQTGRVCSL